ncbi:MAG TPA: cache domain-containing protein, partial [Armatimonadota bacterium]|nr:cache domain-containing protein [Armatimonadota bacterium]
MPNAFRIIWTWLRQAHESLRGSLRGRLLYALAALFFFLAALEGGRYLYRIRERKHLLQVSQERAAQAYATHVLEDLQEVFRSQRLIADSTLTGRIPREAINPLCDTLRGEYPGLVELQLIGPDGVVQYGSPTPKPENVSDEPFYQALASQPTYVAPGAYYEEGDPEPRLRVASRVKDASGGIIGTVSMEFHPSVVGSILPGHVEDTARLLLDETGRLIKGGPAPAAAAVARDPKVLAAVRSRIPGPVRVRLESGEEMIGYSTPVPGTGWTLVSVRSDQDAMASVGEDTRQSLILLLCSVLGMGITMWLLVNLSLRPVARLSAATRRLGGGDFT